MNPSVILHSVLVALLACIAGCKEQGIKESSMPEVSPEKATGISKRENSTGEEVRRAAQDPTLPPEVRESAIVLERILNGERVNLNDFNRAYGRMLVTRSDATCKIWISMLLAAEAGMPDPLPTKEAMVNREKLFFEGKVERFGTEPTRFLSYLSECVGILTEYDMPQADREVDGFMKRFESRSGSSEVGTQILGNLKIEISQAKEARNQGRVAWKQRQAAERK